MQTTVTHEPTDRVVVDTRTRFKFWHEKGNGRSYREWMERLALWKECVAQWYVHRV